MHPCSLANELREKYSEFNNIPVLMVSMLLKDLHIQVDKWPIRQQCYSGMLWNFKGQWHILVNSNHSKTRRLFTIGHELYHYFAHRHIKNRFACFNVGSSATGWMEQDANRFSAEILMPRDIVTDMVQKYPPAVAAKVLGVSEQAMNYRIKELNLK